MVTRRKTLQFMLAGIAACAGSNAFAAAEIMVYYSPD